MLFLTKNTLTVQWRKTAFLTIGAFTIRKLFPQNKIGSTFQAIYKNFKMDHRSKYKVENIKLVEKRICPKIVTLHGENFS
jgi:hypothetical protein